MDDIVETVLASIVYFDEDMMDVIWYSWFNMAAVIFPPRLDAPEKVTKSFWNDPFDVFVTTIVAQKTPADVE